MKTKDLINAAAEKAGNQIALAEMVGVRHQFLSDVKNGRKPCSLKLRMKLAMIADADLQQVLLAAALEEMESEENELEKKAAEGLMAVLATFPDWRKR